MIIYLSAILHSEQNVVISSAETRAFLNSHVIGCVSRGAESATVCGIVRFGVATTRTIGGEVNGGRTSGLVDVESVSGTTGFSCIS